MLRSVVLSTAGVPCCTVTTLEPPLTLPGPAPVCPPLHVPWSLLRHWWPSTGAHQLSSVTRRGAEDQCVMVMLTCPTFVIHLCDNWDRCFHVHPQCVHNQGQRLVNTLPAYSGPTSSQHQSTPTTATAASVLCDNNHQVWILPPVVTSSTQQTWSEETVTMSHLTFSYSSLPTTTSHHQVSSTLQSASHTPLSLFSFYDL